MWEQRQSQDYLQEKIIQQDVQLRRSAEKQESMEDLLRISYEKLS